MVIQRLQSLLLLIATILVGITCFLPLATVGDCCNTANICLTSAPALLVLNIATAVLLLITIFLFKNLRQQMMVAKIDAVLIVVSIISSVLTQHFMAPTACPNWCSIALSAVAFVCTVLAHRYMGKDKKLLSSYDRLR
jgi:membrane-associated HD superfamily phosphohydrolase